VESPSLEFGCKAVICEALHPNRKGEPRTLAGNFSRPIRERNSRSRELNSKDQGINARGASPCSATQVRWHRSSTAALICWKFTSVRTIAPTVASSGELRCRLMSRNSSWRNASSRRHCRVRPTHPILPHKAPIYLPAWFADTLAVCFGEVNS
jgi:hypothetical protein